MAAIALPEVDRQKLERIRDRLTPLTAMDLSDIELPGLEGVGRRAERTVDRLTGRSRTSIWPRLALGLGLLALVGLAVVIFGSSRRGAWGTTEPGDLDADAADRPVDAPPADLAATTITEPPGSTNVDPTGARVAAGGLTAAETSLMSTDPAEEAL
ncbi:MAG: hypothetical protein ACAH65_05875 [Chloroflexota bacterium]